MNKNRTARTLDQIQLPQIAPIGPLDSGTTVGLAHLQTYPKIASIRYRLLVNVSYEASTLIPS